MRDLFGVVNSVRPLSAGGLVTAWCTAQPERPPTSQMSTRDKLLIFSASGQSFFLGAHGLWGDVSSLPSGL